MKIISEKKISVKYPLSRMWYEEPTQQPKDPIRFSIILTDEPSRFAVRRSSMSFCEITKQPEPGTYTLLYWFDKSNPDAFNLADQAFNNTRSTH